MADGKLYLARVTHPDWEGNALILRPDWTWEATDPAESAELAMARHLTVQYNYSPSAGRPGSTLAHQVSQRIPGSKVETPVIPKDPPGTVY